MHFDQAASLRNKLAINENPEAKIISVISGKGGVGKSNISLNLAVQLSKKNKKVLVIDCDVGMANIDILMGYQSNNHLLDVLFRGKSLKECITQVPLGFSFIGGGSALEELTILERNQASIFVSEFQSIVTEFDYILLDFGAGMSPWHLSLLDASHEIIVITTTEPTSIMDAYASLKLLNNNFHNQHRLRFIINRVESEKEAHEIYERLKKACEKFLELSVEYFGSIHEDRIVTKAVKSQVPFSLYEPKCKASRGIIGMVDSLVHGENNQHHRESFVHRFKKLFFERK